MSVNVSRWRWLFENVQPQSLQGWTTTDYLSRSDTSLANEPLTFLAWARVTAHTAGARQFITLGNGGATTGHMTLRLTAGDVVAGVVQDDAGVAVGTATCAVVIVPNTWFATAALLESTTSRYAWVNGTLGAQSTTSVTDPTPDFQAIGVSVRSTVTLPFTNGSLALPTILDVIPTVEQLERFWRGRHPAFIWPGNIVRAWWQYPGFPKGFDFSTDQANLTETGTAVRRAVGPPILLTPRRPIPFRNSAAAAAVGRGLTHGLKIDRRALAA